MVYFIQKGESGPIKIGRTTNIKSRIKSLQTGSDESLSLLHTLDYKSDKPFHRAFNNHHISGEWFEPADEIFDFIKNGFSKWYDNPDINKMRLIRLQVDLLQSCANMYDCSDKNLMLVKDIGIAFNEYGGWDSMSAEYNIVLKLLPHVVRKYISDEDWWNIVNECTDYIDLFNIPYTPEEYAIESVCGNIMRNLELAWNGIGDWKI